MVTITATGELVSGVAVSKTKSGANRANFVIRSTDGDGSLPLHFDCTAFGKWGDRAVEQLTRGCYVLLHGRFVAGGTTHIKASISVSTFELLTVPAEVPNEPLG